ncbi:unnamed protein product [Didymodactylos carnosus]|uniref:Uncharacterized protein n=1 Tax=Didymodactylos carnosus TaxID=1234261 RepID=A0A8S2FDZ7_9BILA|nr:unnamed protein product [Didymodactylos carnosus]CAF4234034.1 unnamed protein product [Didymodactylos carnosus]
MLVSIFQLQRMKYKEFDRLVECAIDTSQWQLIYENMTNTTTRNSSNTISTFNLRELFAACGIVISNRVLKNIIEQHCPDGEIDVINWLIIMCKTDAIFHCIQQHKQDNFN